MFSPPFFFQWRGMDRSLARRVVDGTFLVLLQRWIQELEAKFFKCKPSPSVPSARTYSSKQSQFSFVVFSKQPPSLFLSFNWYEDISAFQIRAKWRVRAPSSP